MTELETLQRAKLYIDKLANGMNPLTDAPLSEDDCVNQVRISRCLFFVSDILRKVIADYKRVEAPQNRNKTVFTITPEELGRYSFDEKPVSVSELTVRINALVDPDKSAKLKHTNITAFLLKHGFLIEQENDLGNTTKVPTERGSSIGISREERQGQNGPYFVTVYNADAQRFILDNIEAIAETNATKKAPSALSGKPWTTDHDEILADLFNKQVSVPEIAVTLKRSTSSIRARLKKLGLIK